jgi:hypothetical protein
VESRAALFRGILDCLANEFSEFLDSFIERRRDW